MRSDAIYIPPLPWPMRARNAIRHFYRTNRARLRQIKATVTPWGWLYIWLATLSLIFGGAMAFRA